jgi:hypothetical protein
MNYENISPTHVEAVDVPCYVTLVQARDSASDIEKFI